MPEMKLEYTADELAQIAKILVDTNLDLALAMQDRGIDLVLMHSDRPASVFKPIVRIAPNGQPVMVYRGIAAVAEFVDAIADLLDRAWDTLDSLDMSDFAPLGE